MYSNIVEGDNDFTLYFKFNEPINQPKSSSIYVTTKA